MSTIPIYSDAYSCYAVAIRSAVGSMRITITAQTEEDAKERAKAFGTPEQIVRMHSASGHNTALSKNPAKREELFKSLIEGLLL